MKSFAFFLMLCVVGILCNACFTEADCIVTATTEIKIEFKQNKLDPKTKIRSLVDTLVSFQSIRVSGIDTVYSKNIVASSVTLPINPTLSSVDYVFVRNGRQATAPKVNDTLSFTYTNETRIISSQCGAFVYFIGLEVKKSSYSPSQYKILNNQLLKGASNVQVVF